MIIQKIPFVANYPNQTQTFTANNQQFTINLYWRGYINLPSNVQDFINTYAPPNFFADLYLQTQLIIAGTQVIDRLPINSYPSNMTGYIVSIDSTGSNNPTLETLGITTFIYYIDSLTNLSELAAS